MTFNELAIAGAYLIAPTRHEDDRGFFARSSDKHAFEERGLTHEFVQCSISHNRHRGTLRGMHYQAPPRQEVKLIRCTKGRLYDVIIDLRPDSPSFGKYVGMDLAADDHAMLYVPKGCAHGFLTLDDDTEVYYQISEYYAPDCARGVRYDDPAFGVDWPAPIVVIKDRDAAYPDYDAPAALPAPCERGAVVSEEDDEQGSVVSEEDDERGAAMHELARRLFPLCRSLTGDGVRATLRMLQEYIPLEIHEVATGTCVYDWEIPMEWNIRDAYIKDADGNRLVDFNESNLHVVGYSAPVRAQMRLEELRPHIHTLPEHPDWIPYRTAYYDNEAWGFCMRHRTLEQLTSRGDDSSFDVCIDASLEPGALTYGEYFIPGESEEEVLLSCHVCHPSMANDNVSGIVLAAQLAGHLRDRQLRYSYRLLFAPATIGALTWMSTNEERLASIQAGLVIACVGRPGPFVYKQSRKGTGHIDRAAAHVLAHLETPSAVRPFEPVGYDERQYGSPGFNLPVGRLTRSPHGEYPEYHTSADDLQLITPEALSESLDCFIGIIDVLERDRKYVNNHPFGEPQLGRRGLYRELGGTAAPQQEKALLWTLNLSDGSHTLLDIAERARLSFADVDEAARLLESHRLITPTNETTTHDAAADERGDAYAVPVIQHL